MSPMRHSVRRLGERRPGSGIGSSGELRRIYPKVGELALQSVTTRVADHAVEYALLGPFEARSVDGPLRLGAPKSRALLALLALHANRVVPRERLIDSLWGDEPPGTAVKAIQVYVSQLRKVLPAGTLQSHSRGYLLRVEPRSSTCCGSSSSSRKRTPRRRR